MFPVTFNRSDDIAREYLARKKEGKQERKKASKQESIWPQKP